MQSFQDFFIIHERSTWGKDTIQAGKVAEFVMNKILDKSLDLFKNTVRINMPMFKLEIILKSFNNYKSEDYNANAFFIPPTQDGNTAKIEIFIFEIYSKLKNYRGYPKDKLNTILYNFVQKNYSTELFKALQHELEHAFEFSRLGSIGFSQEMDSGDNFKGYLNRHEEVNARIVEHLYPTNRLWNLYFRKGEWLAKRPPIENINLITNKIVNSFPLLGNLDESKKRKFIKGIYSTLNYLWSYYTKQSEQQQFGKEIKNADVAKLFNQLTK